MVRIRPAVSNDRAFVQHMLVLAADWRPGVRLRTVDEVLAEPALARYVDGWQRPGDSRGHRRGHSRQPGWCCLVAVHVHR